MADAAITPSAIDVMALLHSVQDPGDGAQLLFVGVVRNQAEGRAVSGMRYDAYEEMANEVLLAIAGEAESEHDVSSVRVVHRIGELVVGEASVAIAVGGPHRDPAYRASRYMIEEIKKRLPIWKHEHFIDGDARWVEGTPLTPAPRGDRG